MSNSRLRLLCISHDASLTGAPISLLHILRALKQQRGISFDILLKRTGPLESSFREIGTVSALDVDGSGFGARLFRRLKLADTLAAWKVRRQQHKFARQRPDLIYANSVESADVLERFLGMGAPVLLHVCEMDYIIRNFCPAAAFERIKDKISRYITVSHAVKNNLANNHGIPEEKISVVYPFLQAQPAATSSQPGRLRQSLGIPPEALIVGACGTAAWHKGPDLFLQLALQVVKRTRDRPLHFVWAGHLNAGGRLALEHDLNRSGLAGKVHFVGGVESTRPYYEMFDVFALMSREDSFPLVILEAATCGVPVICFDKSGGSAEFVGHGCGRVVPYLDIEAMSEAVIELLLAPKLRARMGVEAMERVKNRHNSVICVQQIEQIIREVTQKEPLTDSLNSVKLAPA